VPDDLLPGMVRHGVHPILPCSSLIVPVARGANAGANREVRQRLRSKG
jgi:hypothetical protein